MPQIEVDGATCAYGTGGREWAPGLPLVVLVHGAGADRSVWALQARYLGSRGYNVVALDLPGHGRSDDLDDLANIDNAADWLARVIDGLGASSRVAVAGHSMGACIALTLAAKRPELVQALALLGAAQAMPVNEQLLDDTLHQPSRAHRFITTFGHSHATHVGGAQSPGVWTTGAAMALLERTKPEVLHRDFSACSSWSSEPWLERVVCPTLVIAGAKDSMTPLRGARALVESLVRARLEVLDDCGHMLMGERPREVSRALGRFLKGAL